MVVDRLRAKEVEEEHEGVREKDKGARRHNTCVSGIIEQAPSKKV